MKRLPILLILAALLTGCVGAPSFEQGSYLRVSRGSFGAKLMQWLGLAAEGEYCQITSNEINYRWTVTDLEFFKDQCPDVNPLQSLEQFIEENRR